MIGSAAITCWGFSRPIGAHVTPCRSWRLRLCVLSRVVVARLLCEFSVVHESVRQSRHDSVVVVVVDSCSTTIPDILDIVVNKLLTE